MFRLPCFVLVQFIAIVAAVGDVSRCPSHLTNNEYLKTYGERCYKFVTYRKRTWEDAQEECRADHVGRLVDIPDAGVQHFIYNTLRGLEFHQTGVWIGLTDKDAEGIWKWTSGSSVSYTNWAPGQPGFGHSVEDCALMKMSDHGGWNDYHCHALWDHCGYVCVYDMLPVSTTTVSPSHLTSHGTQSVASTTQTATMTTPKESMMPSISPTTITTRGHQTDHGTQSVAHTTQRTATTPGGWTGTSAMPHTKTTLAHRTDHGTQSAAHTTQTTVTTPGGWTATSAKSHTKTTPPPRTDHGTQSVSYTTQTTVPTTRTTPAHRTDHGTQTVAHATETVTNTKGLPTFAASTTITTQAHPTDHNTQSVTATKTEAKPPTKTTPTKAAFA